jgi:hypothetical protein
MSVSLSDCSSSEAEEVAQPNKTAKEKEVEDARSEKAEKEQKEGDTTEEEEETEVDDLPPHYARSKKGPHRNVARGPKECPWGGPEEGDDRDCFFLQRGDEHRLYWGAKWDSDDWRDHYWLVEAEKSETKRLLWERQKTAAWTEEDEEEDAERGRRRHSESYRSVSKDGRGGGKRRRRPREGKRKQRRCGGGGGGGKCGGAGGGGGEGNSGGGGGKGNSGGGGGGGGYGEGGGCGGKGGGSCKGAWQGGEGDGAAAGVSRCLGEEGAVWRPGFCLCGSRSSEHDNGQLCTLPRWLRAQMRKSMLSYRASESWKKRCRVGMPEGKRRRRR